MDPKMLELKKLIENNVFTKKSDGQIAIDVNLSPWIFDFRKILMNGRAADLTSEIFYNIFNTKYPFQLCTLEIAGVSLMTSIMAKFYYKGHKDINAFFIRKSRKKDGLMKMVEGTIEDNKKIILVDDIMNSGNSFWRQIEVLEELGFKIDTVWSILRFRELDYYTRFRDRNIKIESIFTLDDFASSIGEDLRLLKEGNKTSPAMPFETQWVFKSGNPSYDLVVSKSQPLLDKYKVYFGADNETFWAINQKDGSVAWEFKVGPRAKRKSISSNPAMYEDVVIFGSYDGNVYALDHETGRKRWVCFEADWVGSSPSVAHDLGMVFIGLEFGLFRKHGGVIALDAATGKKIWCNSSHPAYTHSTPLYVKEHGQVVIGSNDGTVRLYDAKTGNIVWKFTTFGGTSFDYTLNEGFGDGEIKESFAYNSERDYLVFGSTDGFLYILERSTGHLVHHHKCFFGIWATPHISGNKVYFTSTDKFLRCINLDSLEVLFEKNLDGTRILSSPTIINNRLYVGTNGGRLHELDPDTGEQLGYYQALERITNSVVYNAETDSYFLPTYANEIICIHREV